MTNYMTRWKDRTKNPSSMVRSRRRRTTAAPSLLSDSSTVASSTGGENLEDNEIPLDFETKNLPDFLEELAPDFKNIWEKSLSPAVRVGLAKELNATTYNKNKPINGFEEYLPFDLRDEKSSFTEDRHSEDGDRANKLAPPARNHEDILQAHPKQFDLSPHPPIWHSVHQPRAPFISFWPVGILMMAVFIIGFVSMLLCRVMASSRPTNPRRGIRLTQRPSGLASRPGLSPRSNFSEDDEGGFGDRSRRRNNYAGNGGSDPPRAATPPPPYPGTPPGATVYVNPLDGKTLYVYAPSVPCSPQRTCGIPTIPENQELPPPYPGTWTIQPNPIIQIDSTAGDNSTTTVISTSHPVLSTFTNSATNPNSISRSTTISSSSSNSTAHPSSTNCEYSILPPESASNGFPTLDSDSRGSTVGSTTDPDSGSQTSHANSTAQADHRDTSATISGVTNGVPTTYKDSTTNTDANIGTDSSASSCD